MAPPAVLPSVLRRRALEERLDELFEKRLAVVVAGAGFGKSTLLAAWTADLERVWYTATPQDRELGALTRRLGETVRRRFPGLAPELSAALPAGESESDDRDRADAVAAQVCHALERLLTHDLVLVVDDLHELEAAPSCRLIEGFCRHAPPTLHVVLASRAEPPFPLDRMRGQGLVIELTGDELAFSREEVEKLVLISLGAEDPDFAGFVYEATAGWPAAVRLGLEAVRRVAPEERKTAFGRMREPGGALFSYLATEVFEREPLEVRELLAAVAPFERFTPGLCEALGFSRAVEALASLARRGLFLQQISGGGDGSFSLHALVREFALERVAPETLRAIQRRAARWFQAQGHLPEALRALTAARDHSRLAQFLKQHGTKLLGRGHVELIATALSSLPGDAADAELEELRGELELAGNRPDTALACFERAFAGSATLSAGQARRMGYAHTRRGRHDRALEVYARGRLDGSAPRDEALLLSWAARSHYVVGNLDACRECARESLERATALGDAEALANAHRAMSMLAQLEGNAVARETHMARSLEYGERGAPLPVQALDRAGQAIFDLDRGLYAKAVVNADRALQLGELMGGSRVPQALAVRGQAKAGLGRLDEALVDLEAARAVWEEMDSDWTCDALSGLGDVYRERGDLSLAQAAYEQAIARAEKGRSAHALTAPLASLALVLAAQDGEEATRLVRRALSLGPGPQHARAVVAAGWVALVGGDWQEAARCAEVAAAEARACRYRPVLARALELAAMSSARRSGTSSLLEEAHTVWHELQNPLGEARVDLALARLSGGPGAQLAAARAERRLRRLGIRLNGGRAAGLLAFLPREERPPVEVRCFGRFEVRRGGEEISWRSRKARDLLKILVARRGRPAPRELLIEALWPGEHPDRAAKRLSVALSTVRGALDPDKRYDADHFVRVEKGVVELVRSSLTVDMDAFFGEGAAGFQLVRDGRQEEAVERLEYAESVYAGDFLEEDRFEDWAESAREEARAAYVSVARTLAEHAGAHGDHDNALRYLLRILEQDQYDEEVHLAVARCLTIAGRHGEARRAYRRYVRRMEQIGVEPVSFLAASHRAAATQPKREAAQHR
jgi:ATP/maltotriose-dependent transcriptional regulator MalT/DNA-binding SARP family transcriptional activator